MPGLGSSLGHNYNLARYPDLLDHGIGSIERQEVPAISTVTISALGSRLRSRCRLLGLGQSLSPQIRRTGTLILDRSSSSSSSLRIEFMISAITARESVRSRQR